MDSVWEFHCADFVALYFEGKGKNGENGKAMTLKPRAEFIRISQRSQSSAPFYKFSGKFY